MGEERPKRVTLFRNWTPMGTTPPQPEPEEESEEESAVEETSDGAADCG